jgi:hypothetical protein
MPRPIVIAIFLLAASCLLSCDRQKKITADPAKPLQVSLAAVNTGNGLQPLNSGDGRTTPATIAGSPCRTAKSNPRGHAYIYFAIDAKLKSPQGAPRNGKIQIEYFDVAPGELRMQYDGPNQADDGHGAYSGSGHVETMTGDQSWKTATFPFHDAIFKNRQNAHADFRLEAKQAPLYLRKVTLLRD